MFRRSAGSLVCTLLALLAAATAASAARAPRIWFPMNRLPLAHATRLGAASPSQRMEIGVGLKDPHPAAEQALMAAQQNPASPQYHHFLTPAQYDKRFAVSKTTFQRTLTWLRGGGAKVLDTSAARNFVEISATSPRSTTSSRPRSAATRPRASRSWPTRARPASPPGCTSSPSWASTR